MKIEFLADQAIKAHELEEVFFDSIFWRTQELLGKLNVSAKERWKVLLDLQRMHANLP